MVTLVALQVIDNVLIDFSVGQVLLYVFLLSVPAAAAFRSWRVFELLLVATPGSLLGASGNGTPLALSAPQFRTFGVGLLLAGPPVFTVLARYCRCRRRRHRHCHSGNSAEAHGFSRVRKRVSSEWQSSTTAGLTPHIILKVNKE